MITNHSPLGRLGVKRLHFGVCSVKMSTRLAGFLNRHEVRPMGAYRFSKSSFVLATALLALTAACGRRGGGFSPPPTEVSIVTVQPETVPVSYEFSAQVVPYR